MSRELRGKWDKVQGRDSREYVNDQNDKLHVLGGASCGRSPPRVKVPNVIHG